MRIIGVDFGSKRIGLAVGESEYRIATPRRPLDATGTLKRDAEAIAAVAKQEEAGLVVVGVPINPDGGDKMEKICRKVAELIQEQGLAVETVDESFTSVGAEANLADIGMKASDRRKLKDGEAAARILERYWDAQATEQS